MLKLILLCLDCNRTAPWLKKNLSRNCWQDVQRPSKRPEYLLFVVINISPSQYHRIRVHMVRFWDYDFLPNEISLSWHALFLRPNRFFSLLARGYKIPQHESFKSHSAQKGILVSVAKRPCWSMTFDKFTTGKTIKNIVFYRRWKRFSLTVSRAHATQRFCRNSMIVRCVQNVVRHAYF